MKKIKIFIVNHPAGLLLFENFSKIIKKYDKNITVVLFKINHVYWSVTDFESHRKFFDKVIDFNDINYNKRHFVEEYFKIAKFISKLNKTEEEIINSFDEIDIFMDNSAWLSANIMLYSFSKIKKIKNIYKITYNIQEEAGEKNAKNIKIDKFKTFLLNVYSLLIPCYPVNVIVSADGKFMDFKYKNSVPGEKIKIVNFAGKESGNDVLPYPVIPGNHNLLSKGAVFIAGDAGLFPQFGSYFRSQKDYVFKMKEFMKVLKNKYKGCDIYYKPHPADKGGIMEGVDENDCIILDNKTNAQFIFNDNHKNIKAVYTVLSTAAIYSSSYYGIPSYSLYKYLFNETGRKRIDVMFENPNIKSEFLLNISNLGQVAGIDNAKRPDFPGLSDADYFRKYKLLLE